MPGDGTTEPKLVDNHDYLNSTQEDGLHKQIYEKFLQEMSEEESKCIKELLKESNEAGSSLGSWFNISLKKKKIKKKWEIYAGGENLLNIRQNDLIRMATDPQSPYFDPTMVWGPSLGAMFYTGFRYYIR